MRNVLSVIVAAAGLGLLATGVSAQAPNTKIAFIDSRRIISEAPGAKEAQATFDKEMQGYQGQLKVMEDSLKAMMDDYQQKSTTLSPEAKKQKEDAIRAKQEAYQQKASALEEQAGNRQQQLVQPVMDRIKAVISQIRQEGNYAMIFDVGGQGSGVVAADTALDLTNQVLARLNAATAAAPTAPPAAPAKPPVKKP